MKGRPALGTALLFLVVLAWGGYLFWPRIPARSPAELLPADLLAYAEFRTELPGPVAGLLPWWQGKLLPILFPEGAAAVGCPGGKGGEWAALFLPGGGARARLLGFLLGAVARKDGGWEVACPLGRLEMEERAGWLVLSWARAVGAAKFLREGPGVTLGESDFYRDWRKQNRGRPVFLRFLVPRPPGYSGLATADAAALRLRVRPLFRPRPFPSVPDFPGTASLEVQVDHPARILAWSRMLGGDSVCPDWLYEWVRPEIRQGRLSLDGLAAIFSIPVPVGRAWLRFSGSSSAESYLSGLVRTLVSLRDWSILRPGPDRLDFFYLKLLGFRVRSSGNSLLAVSPPADPGNPPAAAAGPPGFSLLVRGGGFREKVAPALYELLASAGYPGFSRLSWDRAGRLWRRVALRCEESEDGLLLSLDLSWRGDE